MSENTGAVILQFDQSKRLSPLERAQRRYYRKLQERIQQERRKNNKDVINLYNLTRRPNK